VLLTGAVGGLDY